MRAAVGRTSVNIWLCYHSGLILSATLQLPWMVIKQLLALRVSRLHCYTSETLWHADAEIQHNFVAVLLLCCYCVA